MLGSAHGLPDGKQAHSDTVIGHRWKAHLRQNPHLSTYDINNDAFWDSQDMPEMLEWLFARLATNGRMKLAGWSHFVYTVCKEAARDLEADADSSDSDDSDISVGSTNSSEH